MLGAWHYKSSEEDDCHTHPVESKDRLYAERSSRPASCPAVSATRHRAAGSAAVHALHSKALTRLWSLTSSSRFLSLVRENKNLSVLSQVEA